MHSFYQYMMRYRGAKKESNESKLAEWLFRDHSFPKQSTDYHEISNYLEWNTPFPEALKVYDELWDRYQEETA